MRIIAGSAYISHRIRRVAMASGQDANAGRIHLPGTKLSGLNRTMTRNIPRLSVLRPTRIQRMFRLDFRLSTLFVLAWAVAGPSCSSPVENAQKVTPATVSQPATAKTEAERQAEARRKNLAPRPAPQTGTNLP